MPEVFLNNRMTMFGVVLVILGIILALLGLAVFVNQSVACFVTPGPFPPCITSYQFLSLAPLYPLSGWLIVLGSLLAILGTLFTTLGQSRWWRINRDISKVTKSPVEQTRLRYSEQSR